MRRTFPIIAVALVLAGMISLSEAGLVAHWPLNEGSGSSTVAEAIDDNHGTMVNFDGSEWITDPDELPPILGGTTAALQFDSSQQQYIVATGYKGVAGTDPRTMTAWIRTPAGGNLNRDIITWGTDSTEQKWHFRVQSTNGEPGAIRVEVSGGYIVGGTSVADGQWHHVAAVLPDGATNVNQVALFVDGLYNGTSAVQGRAINTASDADVRIGTGHHNRYFEGAMADVRIYDRAFSHTEMYRLVHGPSVPIAHWALGDAAGPALNAGTLGATADGTYVDTSKSGNLFNSAHRSVPGLLAGGHTGAATYFDGGGGMTGESNDTGPHITLPDVPLLNRRPAGLPHTQRTVEVTFSAEDIDRDDWGRRVLYAEGGGDRGLNVYVRNHGGGDYRLWVGGWNNRNDGDGAPWSNKFVSTPISLQNPFTVQLVLDGAADGNGAPSGHLIGFLNGREFGRVEGVGYLYGHNPAVIGGALERLRHDGGQFDAGDGNWFHGTIDDVFVYNEVPTAGEVAARYASIQPYMNAVLKDNPIAYWRLGEKTTNTAGNVATPLYGDGIGNAVDGTYVGNVGRSDTGLIARDPNGAAYFDGAGRVTIPNHSAINTAGAGYDAKTIEMWFRAEDTFGRQLLYEQGGGTNGLNLYIGEGNLYLGGWAGEGDTWGAWLDTPIEADRTYHVALVYDNETDADDFRGMIGYLDGEPFLTLAADEIAGFDTLPRHTNEIAIAAVAGNTRFHDGRTEAAHFFTGLIDEVALYNDPLSAQQIWNHYAIGVPEPSSAVLALLGVVWLLGKRRRRRFAL